jgi:hypothetical protein
MFSNLVGRRLAILIVVALAGGLPGCGGEMKVAPVAGTVTLDGQPLERASVLFQPDHGGRPSFAVTDPSGNYRLLYSMNEEGAEVGAATVKITTRLQAEDANGEYRDNAPRATERVPARYAKEPVKVTVEPKSNTINIDLTSKP